MAFAPTCPICHRRVSWKDNPYRPFCSKRCQMIDLGAWVTERYRLPGEEVQDTDKGEPTDEGKNDGGR